MKIIILILTACFLFASCEEIIDVQIDSSLNQLIIEANYDVSNNEAKVLLSKTIGINETNSFPLISDANILISNENDGEFIIKELSPGVYINQEIATKVGDKLKLTVMSEGKDYTSYSSVPRFVKFDSLIVRDAKFSGMGPKGQGNTYDITVIFNDPPDELNYYRFIESINGAAINSNFVYDNKVSDGLRSEIKLFRRKRQYESGDTIMIEMQCIDKPAYEYFKSFGETMGGPLNSSSATPANPKTNIIGSTIGYFNVHTSEKKVVIIK